MLGDLSGPELTAYYLLGKQPPERRLPDQASWRQGVSALSDHWSLEELRNQESRWSFHKRQQMPFYHQFPLPASPVCVIGLQ